ncbi:MULTISPECIES: MATE family efflux transporter [unclassified Ensifer]|uniref:MATE family efflux transporter n=1 Tax=unclassified Ensifer TaxID=2633371 RepID=UPI000813B0EB|nr:MULTISPECIES: MATE family efflux transporter [unclassified Ensifer]OCP05071.1 MATE family efflux transporter [Ensifer sp. LC14]OCP11770.1 MATE family efflux transporter [Ensifer sp. LC13]OCP12328.1 MATE family efflux transporter [Ensifer sp. LC11]OCP33706.1 MATE family efflux transporter [Ensifer sp. LC499]
MTAASPASPSNTAGAFHVSHRLILAIALPMTLGFLTTPLLGLVDTAVVGRMGQATLLAGLAVGAIIFDLIFTTFNFLRAATTGLVAQAYGRGDRREQQAVFWRSLIIALACGAASILISPFLLSGGLWLMGPEPEVAAVTSTYFLCRIISAPAALANYAILGFVLGRGEGTIGLMLQTLINGINIVLSILLGLVLGWGVMGVALATVTGEIIGALAGFAIVYGRFDRKDAPSWAEIVDRERLKPLFGLNRDIMIRSFVLLAAFTLMTRIGTAFGPVTLAANAVLMTIFLVAGYYLDGLANAAEQLIGRSIGAHYRPAFDRALRLTAAWSLGLALLTTAAFLLFGDGLIDLLTTAPDVRAVAYEYLPWAAVTAMTGALAFLMDGVFIGATWSREMRNMMVAAFIAYVAALAVLVPAFGNHGLWAGLNLFLLMRGLFLLSRIPAKARQTFRPAQ